LKSYWWGKISINNYDLIEIVFVG